MKMPEIRSDKKICNIVRIVLFTICALVLLVCVFALPHRQSALMYLFLTMTGAAVVAFWIQIKRLIASIWNRRIGRIFLKIATVLLIATVVYAAVISVFMLGAMSREPPEDATLIVLGCQVHGERPSLMLSRRLDAALAYLRNNPDAVAVLSGGQGEGEWITEAEAMRRWLTSEGICGSRLFLEERSTSTYENINFSKAVIEENGLSLKVAIVTDGFHQHRAQFFAQEAGMNSGAVRSKTPFYTEMYYWIREMAAVTAQVIFGALR